MSPRHALRSGPRSRYRAVAAAACLLTVVGAMAVSALGVASLHPHGAGPPDHGQLPDFSLIDHRGQPFTRHELAGSVWVADFIFTRCAGQCPLMTARMASIQQAFAREPDVQFVSFTVDPSHDTPEVLAAYANHHGAHTGKWRFITGDPQAMTALARTGFRLAVGEEEGSQREPIAHSVRFVLVDRNGHIRGYYDAMDAHAMAQLREDTRALLRRRP